MKAFPVSDGRKQFGKEAEEAAVSFLLSNGYRVLQRNFRMRFAEIDIVALDGSTVCFVEVKARSGSSRGSAREAVGPDKQRKLTLAAYAFLKGRGFSGRKARFDVVALQKEGGVLKPELIKNAFDAVV